jgi:hypothetical protein
MTRTIPIDHILFHRLVQGLPGLMPEDSREFAALSDDIADRGIDQPLIVTALENGGGSPGYVYLVDGRNRFKAARAAGLSEVTVEEVEEVDAPGIILATLIHRRHYGKGALAYLAYPLAAKPGHGGDRKSKSTQSTLISVEEIAIRLGFSRDLFFQAGKVWEVFGRRPDLREKFEPRILSGEIGLGACVAGLASSEATTGSDRQDRSPYQLITDTFSALNKRFDQRWEKLEGSARLAVQEEAASAVLAWPEEVQQAIAKAIKAGGRA